MDLNNLILFFSLIGLNLFFYKYLLLVLNKYKRQLFIDDQFTKPQAFHESPISTAGGVGIFFSILIVYFNFLLFKSIVFSESQVASPLNSPGELGPNPSKVNLPIQE